jgi:hypothetical protein
MCRFARASAIQPWRLQKQRLLIQIMIESSPLSAYKRPKSIYLLVFLLTYSIISALSGIILFPANPDFLLFRSAGVSFFFIILSVPAFLLTPVLAWYCIRPRPFGYWIGIVLLAIEIARLMISFTITIYQPELAKNAYLTYRQARGLITRPEAAEAAFSSTGILLTYGFTAIIITVVGYLIIKNKNYFLSSGMSIIYPFFEKDYDESYDVKKEGLEKVLGSMHEYVSHAIIPFQVGGAVDIYRFPDALPGTAMVTMELIAPDGSGPKPSSIGTYELIAFTRIPVGKESDQGSYEQIENRICSLLTQVGRYSYMEVINPGETAEFSLDDNEPNVCLVFDEFKKPGFEFLIGEKSHGLLLVIEIFRSELNYARSTGSSELLARLKEAQVYPYSDMNRPPVA